jgi:hypothetical protein
MYFNRLCSVEISNGIKITDLRIKFEVVKSNKSDQNNAKISIYNLSQTTRSRILNDQSLVRISAGYEQASGLVEIGQGNISDVVHSKDKCDIITTIYIKDGLKALRSGNITLSFAEKTQLGVIIDAIKARLGLPLNYSGFNATASTQGFSYVGSISNALDSLARQYNFNWSIQNGQLQIVAKNKGTNRQIVVLSSKTGLVSSPEKMIKTKKDLNLEPDTYKVTSLLQPQVEISDNIQVESKFLNGVFLITKITHTGDTRGDDFLTEIEVQKSV